MRAQDLIKGSYSTSVQLVAVTPLPDHGIISTAADGKLVLFVKQPMADLQASTIELSCHSSYHLASGARAAPCCALVPSR